MSQRSRRRVCLCHYPHNWAPFMSHSAGLLPTFSVTWPDNSNMPRPFFLYVLHVIMWHLEATFCLPVCVCVRERECVNGCLFIDYCVKRFDLPFIYSLLMIHWMCFLETDSLELLCDVAPTPTRLPVEPQSYVQLSGLKVHKLGNGLCQ